MPYQDAQGNVIPSFDESTRQQIALLNPILYQANSIQYCPITQVGLLARILVPITITFTTSASGTFTNKIPSQANAGTTGNDIPTPYNILPNITLASNEGSQLYSGGAWTNYLLSRTRRTDFDMRNPSASFNSALNNTSVFNLPATYANSTTYTIRFMVDIPIALREANYAGLVLVQNPTTRLQLSFAWSDIAANLLNLAGGGTITVGNVTAIPNMIFFALPDDTRSYPDLSSSYVNLEYRNINLQNGDDVLLPPTGNAYLQLITQYINNGVAMNPLTDFYRHAVVVQATHQTYNVNPLAQLFLQLERGGGIMLPDGVVCWDFTYGTGVRELYSDRDVIDSSRLTNFQIITGISAGTAITGTNYKLTLSSMLAPV